MNLPPKKAPTALPCTRISRSKRTSPHSARCTPLLPSTALLFPFKHPICTIYKRAARWVLPLSTYTEAPRTPRSPVYLPEELNSGGFGSRLLCPTAEVLQRGWVYFFLSPAPSFPGENPRDKRDRAAGGAVLLRGRPGMLPHPSRIRITRSGTASGSGDPPCATNPARSNETTGPREIHR